MTIVSMSGYPSGSGVASPRTSAVGTPTNCKNATTSSTVTESTSSVANTNPAVPVHPSGDAVG